MVIRIRLARFGKARAPVYNIVVTQARYGSSHQPEPLPWLLVFPLVPENRPFLTRLIPPTSTARGSKPMEVLGTYDPKPRTPASVPDTVNPATGLPEKPKKYKDIRLDTSRTKYWLGVGAQPSDPVWRLLGLVS